MGSNGERLRQARKLVDSDPMSRYLGLELVELDEARAVTKFKPTEDHLTALKRIQGGAIFSQADHAIAMAASTLGGTVVTIEVKINFLASAGAGDTLIAEARPLDVKRKISLWQVEIRKESGELIAICQGLAYHAWDKSYEDQ
jgi:acyl-CoA thioesterase